MTFAQGMFHNLKKPIQQVGYAPDADRVCQTALLFVMTATGFWIPNAEISWTQDDCRHVHQITGPQSRFLSKQDAEAFILDTAKAWINSHP